ncbi:anthranilate synthase component II [Dethiobacter alkaliphilus]|uniref:Glutamine amidotransferase of anthranilate synthase n=1 Tax=Dethiobacter alkaliphilus AHT 1 TaxID=555088 RepID=C0GDK7_DETAL|nr:aminodeoxychorismate/anthranilate synthase component II [Dethiobacter alkaliphilus]EEG78490.1 glutamine amidotransferase of anthranilate synthase [Dethiobacter alkaliphilus AHT 1]
MIAVIDNYDSFTYNLVQLLGELGEELKVYRNDRFTIEELSELNPQAIVVSPGPGVPENAGLSVEVIKEFCGKVPILGVCLGHQAIGHCFGGKVVRAPEAIHGKPSQVYHFGDPLFAGLGSPFKAGRYHSLIIDRRSFPHCLEITAETEDGIVMALRHREYPVMGLQFHPESIITPEGRTVLKNFVRGAVA